MLDSAPRGGAISHAALSQPAFAYADLRSRLRHLNPSDKPISASSPSGATLHDLNPSSDAFLAEVLRGLSATPKAIPAKFFYDARGAKLFEQICELPEYYPTRIEIAIMRDYAAEMAAAIGSDIVLVELGSGSGRKTRILLEAVAPEAYLPIDISRDQLIDSANAIAHEFPHVQVHAVCADYSGESFALPPLDPLRTKRRVVYFPGSTIGNFTPAEAARFLRQTAQLAGAGGGLLIGVDLKKSASLLYAAYNDAQGVTAEFNLNLLLRINRELGADFDLAAFEHRAFYDASAGRIEMHLRASRAQQVKLADRIFSFAECETIHTENSYKYDVREFTALAVSAGWQAVKAWTDPAQLFSVHYFLAT